MTVSRILISLALLIPGAFAVAQTGALDMAQRATDVLHLFADASVVDGSWSQLTRTDDSVAMQIATDRLEPGAVYTVWWVIFNNPGACSPEMDGDPGTPVCGEDDIFTADGELAPNPLARISILWASGGMADGEGAATFSAVLSEGETPGEVLVGPALEDARRAEVHLVIRNHGQPDMARLHAQLSSFELEGCAACEDVQFSVFLPVN